MSEIDWSALRSLTARELISALVRDGFFLSRQTGSHQLYRHPDGRRVTVSFHQLGQTFRPKTLRSMIEKEAGWTTDDLIRLKLIWRSIPTAARSWRATWRIRMSATPAGSARCSIKSPATSAR